MRALRLAAVAVVFAALCIPAFAQEKPGDIAIVYTSKAKQGGYGQLESALKKHFGWHKAQKDTFGWVVWEVISGDNIGDFVAGTFGHNWKDFDAHAKFDEADNADFIPNVLPFIDKISLYYYALIPEASRLSNSQQPAPMCQVTHFYVKPSGVVQFSDALKEIKAALDKVNYPVHSMWYRLVNGGEGPLYVLVTERSSWADLEPMSKTLEQYIADATSPSKAVELMSAVRDNTRYTTSEMLQYRPDISYLPAK